MEHRDDDGGIFYYNNHTDGSVRAHPLDGYYRSLYREMKLRGDEPRAENEPPRGPGGAGGAGAAAAGRSGEGGDAVARVVSGKRVGGRLARSRRGSPLDHVESARSRHTVSFDVEAGKRLIIEAPPPTPYELMAMARYLGLHCLRDYDLLWIAEEALGTPLPPQWEEHVDENGNPFYYNSETDESTREHPSDERFFELVRQERRSDRKQPQMETEEYKPWKAFTGQMGNRYYFNFRTEMTAVDLPQLQEDRVVVAGPKFQFALAPDGHEMPAKLVMYSTFQESGERTRKRLVTLTYDLSQERFMVAYDKGKFNQVTPLNKRSEPFQVWDLHVGAVVRIMGQRHSLTRCDAGTLNFLEFNARRLVKIWLGLSAELERYETVPVAWQCPEKPVEKGTTSMRHVMEIIQKIKTRLLELQT